MKTKLFMIAWLAAILIGSSCSKLEYQEPVTPADDQIQVSGLKVATINDTVNVQIKTAVTFKAVDMTNCTWSIHDAQNTITLTGDQVTLNAGFQFLGVNLISVTGSKNGAQTTYTKLIKVVLDIVTVDPVVFLSSHATSNPDTVENWFAISKERMKYFGYYFHIGNYLPSNWQYPITVPVYDTAYYLSGNTPVPAPTGDLGQWIVVKVKNAKNKHYEMGVGKIQGTTQIWGNFAGSQWVLSSNGYVITWNTDNNGVPIIQGQSNDWPLVTGDVGNNPIVRLDQQSTKVILAFNNGVPFSGNQPWVRFRNADCSWGAPIAQTYLSGWPNWGQYELPYSAVPANNLLRFQIGTNINIPSYLNPAMSQSSFYDSFYNELRLTLIRVTGMKKTGGTEEITMIVPGGE